MFNALIILIAVINLTNSQDNPEVDDNAILSGLATSTLECSLKFDHDFVESNEEIAAAIEALIEEREETEGEDSREDSEDTEAPESEGEARRALGGRRGRRGDVTREPLADGVTRQPRQDRTREPRDGTNEPHRRRGDDDSTREPCDDDETSVTGEAAATETPVQLRRNLGGRGRGGRRGRDRDADATGEPLAEGATRAPRSDRTREPCDDDETDGSEATEMPVELRRNLGQRRNRGDDVTGEPLADGATREPRGDRTREPRDATKEPCEGEECSRRRQRRDDDSTREPCDDEDVTGEAEATEAPVQLRRLLGGRDRGGRRGRDRDADVTGEPLADDATRAPRSDRTREPRDNDSTREPCDDETETTEMPIQARRNLGQRRGRGGDANGEPRVDGATREPRGDRTREPRDATKEPCEGEECTRRGRRDDDVTREPCEDDEDVTGEAGATEAPVELRRLLGGRGRGGRHRRNRDADGTGEPLADGATREPRGDRTREPRDATKEPCEGEECSRRQRRDSESSDDETEATEAPVRRQLGGRGHGRRGRDRDADVTGEPLTEGATREPRGDRTREPRDEDSTREPCDDSTREPRRRRKEIESSEEPEGMQRRALKRGNGRGRRGRGRELDAQIVDGHIDISGVEGEVVFGEYDEASESTPLTLTIDETVFHCEVEVNRKGGVSCRAVSEDDFRVQIDCEAVADDELESN